MVSHVVKLFFSRVVMEASSKSISKAFFCVKVAIVLGDLEM